MIVRVDGGLCRVVAVAGAEAGEVRCRLRDLKTGGVLVRTWGAGERADVVSVTRRPMVYSYYDGVYRFMDTESCEDFALSGEAIGEEQLKYLYVMMEVEGVFVGDRVVTVELPSIVALAVEETEPPGPGASARAGTKRAVLVTGAVVQVPLFVREGDVVRVDRGEDRFVECVQASSARGSRKRR